VRGDARGHELSIDEADAFGKQAPSFNHVSHVRSGIAFTQDLTIRGSMEVLVAAIGR
jgi:hypothetical protein